MEGKRYYWLRLHDDFFGSKRIKKLRAMAGGDTFVIIYLKMQLLAMKTDGVLKWTGLEDKFADELALDLDEKPDDVEVTLLYLLKTGLAETDDNISFFFPYAISNTGSETASTQRWRDWKNRKVLESNTTPTLPQQNANVEKEIEKEKEKEIEIEIEKHNRRFTPPSVGEVEAYCKERGNSVDPEAFVDFYASKGWKVGKNPMKDWQAAVRTWEKTDNRGPKDKQTSEASKSVDSSDLLRILNSL